MTRWFTGPNNSTAFVDGPDEATNPAPVGFTEVYTQAAYDAVNAAREADKDITVNRARTHLQWSRSKQRTQAKLLDQGFLETGWQVAVFVGDYDNIVTNIDFYLDAVFHNTETLTPWDYDGTDGFGDANRVTFAVGTHTIQADITDPSGTYSVSATFEVE